MEPGDRVGQFLESRREPLVTKPTSRIRKGDVLRVTVDGVVEVSGEYTVGKDGKIRLPFGEDAAVAGKSLKGAAKALAKSLQSVAEDAKVEVELVERRIGKVEVTGAVKRPGSVAIGLEGRTIADALEFAGGLTDDAAGTVRLVPGGKITRGGYGEAVVKAGEAVEFSTADVASDGRFGGLHLRAGDRLEVAGEETIAAADEAPPAEVAAAESEPAAPPPAAEDVASAPIAEVPPAAEPLPEVASAPVAEPEPARPAAPAAAPAMLEETREMAARAREIARLTVASEREAAGYREKIATLEAEIEKQRATSDVLRARLAVLEEERRRPVPAAVAPAAEPARVRDAPAPSPRAAVDRETTRRREPPAPVSDEIAATSPPETEERAPVAAPARVLGADSVSVEGAVENPGEYPIADARSVRRAVATAGIVAGADLSAVEVVRAGDGGESRIEVNLPEVSAGRSPDLLLEAGDRVVVPGRP